MKFKDLFEASKLSNDEFNRDAEAYRGSDRETRAGLEKKWGARSAYFGAGKTTQSSVGKRTDERRKRYLRNDVL